MITNILVENRKRKVFEILKHLPLLALMHEKLVGPIMNLLQVQSWYFIIAL